MNNTINGRTPAELKGLLANRRSFTINTEGIFDDALACIQQLEAKNAQLQELYDNLDLALVKQTRQLAEKELVLLKTVEEFVEKTPKWISVKERLPEVENENGTFQCTETVLAADKNRYFYTGFFRIYKYDKSIEFVGCDHNSLYTGDFDVTHWMPLPSTEGLE